MERTRPNRPPDPTDECSVKVGRMSLTFETDPSIDAQLRDGLCALWAAVTNADGAVGFVPPITPEEIRPDLLAHLASVDAGRTRMLVGRDGDGTIVAGAFLALNAHRLKRHWCSVYTVMVHPSLQGNGHGRELMAEVEKLARDMEGITALRLTCRGGLGLERFYAGCGYREVGRLPGAIKVADGDLRDDVTLWLQLT
jgi:GNAT superfamily N-acetyltransferase